MGGAWTGAEGCSSTLGWLMGVEAVSVSLGGLFTAKSLTTTASVP